LSYVLDVSVIYHAAERLLCTLMML